MSEHTISITDDDFEKKVLKSDEAVLVDFWAPWCGPCVSLSPTLDALAEEYQGRVTVAKMNVDENKHVPTNYGVRALPYLAVFSKGEIVDSIAGAQPKAKIASMLDKALADQNLKGRIEYRLLRSYSRLAGVDEVGRGCLAGPVYAAAVILDYGRLKALDYVTKKLIRDSKTLSRAGRARIAPVITEHLALAYGVGSASVDEISRSGIVEATFEAMRRALARLSSPIECLLVDGHRLLTGYDGYQECIIKGDQLCYNIAAASIIAKEARDRYMTEQAECWPGYGFESHVGYGTRKHLDALARLGACELHRKTFAPVRKQLAAPD